MIVSSTLVLACTGPAEEDNTTAGATGGSNDDYGVEVPVATSLTLAHFGYESDTDVLSSASSFSVEEMGDGISQISLQKLSSGGTYTVALLRPLPGESCDAFQRQLAEPVADTENYLADRRFFLKRPAFKVPNNANAQHLTMIFDAETLASDITVDVPDIRTCYGVLVSERLPLGKGYREHSSMLAFLEQVETDSVNLYRGQDGFFTKTSVVSGCTFCSPATWFQEHALSWIWDSTLSGFRLLFGQSTEKRTQEVLVSKTGAFTTSTDLGAVTIPATKIIGGVAQQIQGAIIERRAVIRDTSSLPSIWNQSGSGSWSESTTTLFPDYDWRMQEVHTLASGLTSFMDVKGSSPPNLYYRFSAVNALNTDTARLNADITCNGQIPQYYHEAKSVDPDESLLVYTCNYETIFLRLNSSGATQKTLVSPLITGVQRKVPAIAEHEVHCPVVFFAGQSGSPVSIHMSYVDPTKNADCNMANFHVEQFINAPVTLAIEADDSSILDNQTIVGSKAIQDDAGIPYLLLATQNHEQAGQRFVYLGAVFPASHCKQQQTQDCLSLVKVAEGYDTTYSNLILMTSP